MPRPRCDRDRQRGRRAPRRGRAGARVPPRRGRRSRRSRTRPLPRPRRTVIVARAPSPACSSTSSQHKSDRPRDLGRAAHPRGDVDGGVDAGARRGRTQRRSEAARFEQRRVDPLRELRGLVERLLHVAPHRSRGAPSPRQDRRPPTRPASCRLTARATRCCWTPSCRSTLDPAAVVVGGQDEPLPGRVQLRDLEAQTVERFPQLLDCGGHPGRSTSRSWLLEVVRHRARGVNRSSTPCDRGGTLPSHLPGATVVPATAGS